MLLIVVSLRSSISALTLRYLARYFGTVDSSEPAPFCLPPSPSLICSIGLCLPTLTCLIQSLGGGKFSVPNQSINLFTSKVLSRREWENWQSLLATRSLMMCTDRT
jgi:hypothetical protein